LSFVRAPARIARVQPLSALIEATRRRALKTLRSRPAAVGAAIFVLACAARLVLIRTARFSGDEIQLWQQAVSIAQGTDFPLLGPSITGGGARCPGPVFYYVMAVPMLFSKAPEVCNGAVAVLGGAAVWIYWSALRPYFGEAGAALAAALMACMPWSTLYSDRVWNPNTLVFFIAVAFWAACKVRRAPSAVSVTVLFVAAAAMPQFHLSAPMVWVALVPIFLPSIRRWRWWWPVVAMGCAALLYVPPLIYELRTNWENTRLYLAESANNTSSDWQRVPAWAFRLLTLDISYHQLASYWGQHTEEEMRRFLVEGSEDFRWSLPRRAFLILSFVFAAFAVLFSVARAFTRRGRRTPHPFLWAAVLGVLANTALLGLAHKPVYGHYVQSLLPFYFVAFAEIGRAASRWRGAWLAVYGAAAVLCYAGIDSGCWYSGRFDARNGLGTIRDVIAAIERDRPDARSVHLSFGYRSMDWPYNVVAALDPKRSLRFGGGPTYHLVLRHLHGPRGARVIRTTGPVMVYAPL
jgi:hypothetical protein